MRDQSKVVGGVVLALESLCMLAEKTTMPSPTGTERFAGLAATTPIRAVRIGRLLSSRTPTCLHVAACSEFTSWEICAVRFTALLEKGEPFRERSPQHSVNTKG